MKLLAWIRAPFAWKVVRHCHGYTYFENAVTGRRRCHWVWGQIDHSFMRSGDVSYGPFGRQEYWLASKAWERHGLTAAAGQALVH